MRSVGVGFSRDLHTRHAEHNEKLGLKRGNPSSGGVHKPLKEYYKELEQLRLQMEGRVNTLEMVPEMVRIIEVLADAIEQLDPPNQHLAKVARFASRIATKAKNQEHGGKPQTPGWMGVGVADGAASNGQRAKSTKPPGGVLLLLLLLLGSGVSPSH